MDKNNLQQLIAEEVARQLKGPLFTARKITDSPTDGLQVVNRNYVNLYGTVRPTSSVVGQRFFDTTLATGKGQPIYWNATGWVDADGNYV